jgi:hypothetical protein
MNAMLRYQKAAPEEKSMSFLLIDISAKVINFIISETNFLPSICGPPYPACRL